MHEVAGDFHWGKGEPGRNSPVGFLFLQEPPVEKIPIPDFRTIRNKAIARPSPDLLDMIYVCQQRQEWYREFARFERIDAPSIVGSASLNSSVEQTAVIMRVRGP